MGKTGCGRLGCARPLAGAASVWMARPNSERRFAAGGRPPGSRRPQPSLPCRRWGAPSSLEPSGAPAARPARATAGECGLQLVGVGYSLRVRALFGCSVGHKAGVSPALPAGPGWLARCMPMASPSLNWHRAAALAACGCRADCRRGRRRRWAAPLGAQPAACTLPRLLGPKTKMDLALAAACVPCTLPRRLEPNRAAWNPRPR